MGKTGVYLLLSKLPSILLGLIFFFSASQLGLHFWPLSTLVYGVRIDYLSPTIYFLDILIIIYLLIKKFENWRIYDLRIVAPLLLTNLLFSQNPLATLSWSLHFLLYLIFISSFSLTINHRPLIIGLALSLLFQLLLATTQVWLGHSVGGLMYYLGERTVAVGTPGIALGSFMHEVVLRGYGTFGHPNVLAGWFVITLLIILRLSPGSDPLRKSWPTAKMFSRLQNTIRRPGQTLWVLITILGVLLTQSRAGALTLFGLVIPFYLIKNLKMRLLYYFITLLLYYSVFPPLLSPPRSDLSLTQRLDLQGVSSQVIRQYPIFGTGAQASISTYPALPQPKPRGGGGLQPDHNSFTLFLSWFGVFGTLAILYLVIKRSDLVGHPTRSDLTGGIKFLLPLLPLLLLDHYFLTSPQGLFISLLYFYVALNYTHVKNYR